MDHVQIIIMHIQRVYIVGCVWLLGFSKGPCGYAYNNDYLVSSFCIFLEDLARRPKLNLKPRTVKDPVNQLADTASKMSIFGEGKPRDEKEYEKKGSDTSDREKTP